MIRLGKGNPVPCCEITRAICPDPKCGLKCRHDLKPANVVTLPVAVERPSDTEDHADA